MKKIILLLIATLLISGLFADLTWDIPFDENIVVEDYEETEFESEWITFTNNSDQSETYYFTFTYEVPEGWLYSFCHPTGCYMPNFETPISIGAGESKEIHYAITNISGYGTVVGNIEINHDDWDESQTITLTWENADPSPASDISIGTRLISNFPNPFSVNESNRNFGTRISYDLEEKDKQSAQISIYNILGQKVRTFANLPKGNLFWNGKAENGEEVNSGVYFYRLENVKNSQTKKMLIIK